MPKMLKYCSPRCIFLIIPKGGGVLIPYIPLETDTKFFLANLYLQQGISSEFVMVDFICMGLLDLLGAQTKNKMNK